LKSATESYTQAVASNHKKTTNMIQSIRQLPNLEEFYINTSLYTKFSVTDADKDFVFDLLYNTGTIDCFCPDCNEISVFKGDDNRPIQSHQFGSFPIDKKDWKTTIEKSTFTVRKVFSCSRVNEHKIAFYILIKNGILQKIGQDPSIADLNSFGISKFKKILGNELYSEFNRAIGLYSHGVGVGSFVYLRRIIENFMIKPAYEKAKLQPDWNDDEYQRLRVKEKIQILKDYLPKYLIENSSLYSIVSKGIHELSENDCNEYFPVLRECLEYVLTELEAQRQTDLKKKELTKKLSKISGDIK
jgi:hypothetical protein